MRLKGCMLSSEEIVRKLGVSEETPLYQPLEHPDFARCPALQPCLERWELIHSCLAANSGRVIDFGCHTGWFCRQFSRLGWEAMGIERSADLVEIARSMEEFAGERKPSYFVGDLLKLPLPPCDVALCLSVAMYLFDDRAKGWEFFDRVSRSATIMFLDFGGMYSNRLPFNESSVGNEMCARTQFVDFRKIGNTLFENRPLFIFYS
jgi:SAM-dependent methyltransferase